MIPKKIWTFWDSENLPITVKNCLKTWAFFNPNYEIIVLNKSNLKKYLTIDIEKLRHSSDSAARFSDFVRLLIASKYGGIWLDASTICTQSLSEWIHEISNSKTEFIGWYSSQFTNKKQYPVIESWAFACIKGSKFVKKWCREFIRTNKYKTIGKYIDHLENKLNIDFQLITKYDDIEYLAIHASVQKVMQYDKYPLDNMILLDASEGPFKYLLYKKGGVSLEKRIARLCKDYKAWEGTPIIKFTGDERKILEKKKGLRECVFNNVLLKIAKTLTGISP